MNRMGLALGAGALALALSSPAAAAPHKKNAQASASASAKAACVAAHEQGQSLRQRNQLHAAREKFVACAKSECPVVLRKECDEQLAAVEAAAPTLALEARDEDGNSDPNVKVTLDGTVVAEHLTGASIDVEPGDHTLRFERADGKVIEQKILVVDGEKNRKVVADFASLAPKPSDGDHRGPAPETPVRPPEKHVPALAFVAGGLAIAAGASFAIFAIQGKSTENDLAGRCAPNCTSDDVKPVRRDYLVADISLGVAVVAAAVAVLLALPAMTSPTRAAAAPWMPTVRTRRPLR